LKRTALAKIINSTLHSTLSGRCDSVWASTGIYPAQPPRVPRAVWYDARYMKRWFAGKECGHMTDHEEIERIHGKHHTYSVRRKKGGVFSSEKYYVFDADTDRVLTSSFDSRADAVEWAEKSVKQGQ
ncbi:MAG: hypothetical protein ACREBW_10655, partial [Candidatus Micrarchaeaceae archaeon]